MDDSKFLIIGASGQLGTALRAQYQNARAVDSSELDITDRAAVEAFNWQGITHILNAAAYTNVDGAETADGRLAAWQVNAIGARNLAEVAARRDMVLVHISTDYVFDGTLNPHDETEPFSPLGVYGQSKAAGDLAVSLAPKHYILRTSWVIGEGKNFVRTMLELGKRGISPTVVADQTGRLTFTSELVRAIDHLLRAQQAEYGTYNLSNAGDAVSWAEITRCIFAESGYQLSVSDTTTSDYYAGKEHIAPRPLGSTFDLSKIQATGLTLTDWRTNLKQYVEKELRTS